MREIKFRAWDTQFGSYTYAGWGSKTFAIFAKRTNCPRYIIEQFTGLKDKNGTEIYEGDILRWNKTGYCAPVSYEGGWFVLNSEPIMCYVEEAINDDEFDTSKDCHNSEVIGNIHENPELLAEKK